ncbi:hypothetical protein SLA2020_453670 [Shorea laevis]
MDQQGQPKRAAADILDLSVLPLGEESDLNYHSGAWQKELKIRNELEMDIERDLEEEIKDGLYHHALRLHRLYQQQKERNAKQAPGFETESQQRNNNRTLLEVNICISMEGGTKFEIKETRKEADREKGRPRTSRSEKMWAPVVPATTKKVDWVKTLRSNAAPAVIIDRKNGSLHQAKTLANNHCRYSNLNLNNPAGRRNGQPKPKADVGHKLLQLGWKY